MKSNKSPPMFASEGIVLSNVVNISFIFLSDLTNLNNLKILNALKTVA